MKTSRWPRFAILALIALLLSAGLTGCGHRLSGVYVSSGNPKDRIEFVSSSKARVTALQGRALDVWRYGGPPVTEFARQIEQAHEALARYETVEVSCEFVDPRTIRFVAPGRGSRTVTLDPGSEAVIEGMLGRGPYIRTPS